MKRRVWVFALLIFAGPVLIPNPAPAVDTPFSMDNRSNVKLLGLNCKGPLLRNSGNGISVDPRTDSGVFYTATDGLGNQFGEWNCVGFLENLEPENGRTIAFCLEDIVNRRNVVLFLPEGGGIDSQLGVDGFPNITQGGNCDGPQSAASFLGDAPRRGREKPPKAKRFDPLLQALAGNRPDRDHWIVDGTAGDLLTIRLGRDGSAGSLGERATLVLRGHGAAKGVKKEVTGPVPLELQEELPSDAPYSVAVEQLRAKEQDRFLGSYILTVSSKLKQALSLRPHTTVER